MSDVDTLFTIQWGETISQLSQQQQSFFESRVMVKPGVVGERTTMEQLGAITLEKKTTRHAPTPRQDANHQRRWITMFDYRMALWFDTEDELKALLDPRNAYNQGFIFAMNRAKDDEVIAAALATAYYGKAGSSTQANTNSIAAGGVGLSIDKMRQAQELFLEGNVNPDEPKYLAITPDEHTDLLKLTEVISQDYNRGYVLESGMVKRFMGFDIIVSNRLGTTGGNQCIAWAKSGIGLAIAKAPTLRASELPDHDYAWQGYASIGIGASRLEESKVIEILCA